MTVPYVYVHPFVKDTADAFCRLHDELKWLQYPNTPRKEYYVNAQGAPYTYGKGRFARTYLAQPTHPVIEAIRHAVEDYAGVTLDTVFCNFYGDKDSSCGWHSDDEPEMDDERPIIGVSLGAERVIDFRPKWEPPLPGEGYDNVRLLPISNKTKPSESLLLENGSLLLMKPGMQDYWQHRIPKASSQCTPRISLTFRGYAKP